MYPMKALCAEAVLKMCVCAGCCGCRLHCIISGKSTNVAFGIPCYWNPECFKSTGLWWGKVCVLGTGTILLQRGSKQLVTHTLPYTPNPPTPYIINKSTIHKTLNCTSSTKQQTTTTSHQPSTKRGAVDQDITLLDLHKYPLITKGGRSITSLWVRNIQNHL